MEKDFTKDSFERLLKEKSDEFRMYPSNRVWNSIYNNFHPSRKWPSVVMCITLITALLMVGYLNTNTIHQSHTAAVTRPENTSAQKLQVADIPNIKSVTLSKNVIEAAPDVIPAAPSIPSGKLVKNQRSYKLAFTVVNTSSKNTLLPVTNDNEFILTAKDVPGVIKVIEPVIENAATASTLLSTDNKNKVEATEGQLLLADNRPLTANNIAQETTIMETAMMDKSISNHSNTIENTKEAFIEKLQQLNTETQDNQAIAAIQAESNRLLQEQKSWIENYALYNRPAAKKWKGKLALQVYFTPSVIYRKLYSNINENHAVQYGFTSRAFYTDVNGDVVQKPSYGFEAGAGLQYNLFKWAKIKTGLQLNYTRYSIQAYKNNHPASTTLTMVDEKTGLPYEVFRSTSYSNIYGLASTKLHNQTVQLSIPVGVDFRMGGYDNFEWYAGAAIQPTLFIGGSSYLISSDRQNYISEKSMISRLNMNAAFETYFTYKTNSGYIWQLGPQFRTQLFSTNSKFYSVGEKLVSYGFKVGISKKL